MDQPDRLARLVDLVDLAGGAARELNNALNNILLHLLLLEKRGLSAEARSETQDMRQLGIQAAGVLKKWQQLAESQEPQIEAVDLNRFLTETVQSLCGGPSGGKLAVVAKDGDGPGCLIPVQVALAAGLPPVLAIPSDLSRLLKHLLGSSGAAIAPGPGAIHVITEQADGRAALRIEDSGPPLDRDQLSLLFRPFAAVRRGNNGVALAICKVIVARMQGSLQASNKPEGGMSFRVELRLAAES